MNTSNILEVPKRRFPINVCLRMQGGDGWHGGVEYVENIIRAISVLPTLERQALRVILLCHKQTYKSGFENLRTLVDRIEYEEDLSSFNPSKIWQWRLKKILGRRVHPLDGYFKSYKIDIIYPLFLNTTRELPYSAIPWIWDFQHKYLPQFFTPKQIQGLDHIFYLMQKKSRQIVLSSKTCESDFRSFYPKSSAKIHILRFYTVPQDRWYAADFLAVQKAYELPDRFFMVCNQFWRHKNHGVIIKALHLLALENVRPVLVCTGGTEDSRNPSYFPSLLAEIETLGLKEQVRILGFIPKDDQIQLLRRSVAVIQPSLCEGWSTVLENARILGKALIVSNLAVHKEQNVPRCRYFNPLKPEELAELMKLTFGLCTSNPDPKAEEEARRNGEANSIQFARDFVSLAEGSLR